jgi:hypothetical protein
MSGLWNNRGRELVNYVEVRISERRGHAEVSKRHWKSRVDNLLKVLIQYRGRTVGWATCVVMQMASLDDCEVGSVFVVNGWWRL